MADETEALGHSYDAVVTAPDCKNGGYTTYTCSVCGDSYVANPVNALGHSYVGVVTPPTYEDNGYTTYTCSKCGVSYVTDEVNPLAHSYKATVTAPTCEAEGYTTYTCSDCGDSYVTDKVAAKGHSYKSVVTAPTCEAEGYTTYTCSDCGDSYVTDKVAAKGHSYKSVVTAPTCESAGYTTYTCSVCGDSYKEELSALGHTQGSPVEENKVEATCTANGSYDSVVYCTVCKVEISRKTVTVAANGHTTTTVKGYAATCTTAGMSDGSVCSVCNVTVVEQTAISPLGHNWQEATTEAPKTCIVCFVTEGEKLPSSSSGYSDTLYVTYINVGQGDSILIQVGDCDILIDAGTASYGSTVSNYLKNQGVDDIELMINTHPDADHCGGLTTVLNNFVVEEVWISKDTSKTTAAYKNFTAAITSEGLTAKQPNAGYVYTYEYLTLTVLYSAVGSDSNNSSIVVMMEYGNFKFLFTGDIGEEVETQLVSSGKDLSCDVLKVGHHGSKYSSTASFLSATGADYGVICVGSNSYGHPTTEALNRLSAAGISVYRTDTNGNVVFSSDGATLTLPGGGSVSGGSGSGTGGGSSSGGSSSGTTYYIGNSSTKVYHLPSCSYLPDSANRVILYSTTGYTPCGHCIGGSSGTTTYIANKNTKTYHLSTCSRLPSAANRITITDTTGYKPCSYCIGSKSITGYVANVNTNVYSLSAYSYLPIASKQKVS